MEANVQDERINELTLELKVNNAVLIVGAGISIDAGMPLYKQMAPTIWKVVQEFPDILEQIEGVGTAKNRIGTDFSQMVKAFSLIEKNQKAAYQFKNQFKVLNDKTSISKTHDYISKLLHSNIIELVVSFNWDTLLEKSWRFNYGTEINSNKTRLLKPHGDVNKIHDTWIFPNSPGQITQSESNYIKELASSNPRTLIIMGYSEQDETIVDKLIKPYESNWKVYRIGPSATGEGAIQITAERFLERLVPKLTFDNGEEEWEYLNFLNQTSNLGNAIMGYRLSPKDVSICPRLPQVKTVINDLEVTNTAILKGKPGAGKSIVIYQSAFELLKQGFEVRRLNTSLVKDRMDLDFPEVANKTLFIIDDGQILSKPFLEKMLENSSQDRKFILAITDDFSLEGPSITISNTQSVKTVYEAYLQRKNEVLGLVSKLDKDVNENFLGMPIERRLEIASRENNLWNFNYVLRGGWNTIKDDYYIAKDGLEANIVLTLIACKQLMQLDANVEVDWLKRQAILFNKNSNWIDESISYLREKNLISQSEIRLHHIQATGKIIGLFFSEEDRGTIYKLVLTLQNEFKDNAVSLLGIVWFLGRFSRHTQAYQSLQQIFTDQIIDILVKKALNADTPENIKNALFFLRTIDWNFRDQINLFDYQDNIKYWLENVTNESAYAMGDLINSLYNLNNEKAIKFLECIELKKLALCFDKMQGEYIYSWGHLLNRINICLREENKRKFFFKHIKLDIMEKAIKSISLDRLASFCEIIVSIYLFDPVKAYELAYKYFYIINENLNRSIVHTWRSLDFSFQSFIMGYNTLDFEGKDINENTKKFSRKFVDVINPDQMALEIESGELRDWHDLAYLMFLIDGVNPEKHSQIIEKVNLDLLKESLNNKKAWITFPDELTHLLYILAYEEESYEPANSLIYSQREEINKFPLKAMFLSPPTVVYLYEKGISQMFIEDGQSDYINWYALNKLTKGIYKENLLVAQKIFRDNLVDVSHRISNIQEIDFEDNIQDFIDTIHSHDKQYFELLIQNIDFHKMKESINKIGNYYQDEYRVKYKDKGLRLLNSLKRYIK
ncbi:hypothetical protein [Priestia sp. JSM ZJ58]|uniref:hypothetical protein n=1 Tax=Priestia sp. JSM ZJ58 TaxID=3376189 RepID=UPI0037B97446